MSDFSGLNTAVTGLHAHKNRIDVISENIANVETPGYHRRVSHLSPIDTRYPGVHSGAGGDHAGVTWTVTRNWDALLDGNAKQERSRTASMETQAAALEALEAEIGSLSSDGLADRLQKLWNSFDDLANDPKDLAVRNVVLGAADAVAASMNHQGYLVDEAHSGAVQQAQTLVDRVNALAAQIAEIDTTVVAGVAAGNPPNGMIDQRDRLADELSSIVNLQVGYEADGQIKLSVDGHNLVVDGQASTIRLEATPDPGLGPLGYDRISVTSKAGRNLDLMSGALHGSVLLANDLVPQQRRELDEVAASIVTTVNALHVSGAGLDGVAGRNLFDPGGTMASTLSVSTDVAGQPNRIAASDGTGILDNSVALTIAQLGTDPLGPSAKHADLLANLGNRVNNLNGRLETAQMALSRAEAVNQSQVGVSLDEELSDLISAQRAYEASARMISTIDEMLDVLINRTGLVGR